MRALALSTVTKKTEFIAALLKEHRPAHPYPEQPPEGLTLTEHAVYLVLLRHMTANQAEATLKSLRAKIPDWNEMRVSQSQEIAACFRTSSRKKGSELLLEYKPATLELKLVLQEIFQQLHGLELDEIREDVAESHKLFAKMPVLGPGAAAYLQLLAGDGLFPVTPAVSKLLEKLGVINRTSSTKKAEAALAPLVPAGREMDLAIALHEIAAQWDDEEQPAIERYESLRLLPAGKKAYEERKAAVAKAEAAAARDAERERKRLEAERKKAEAEAKRAEKKRLQEEERARKKAEREAKRKAAQQKKQLAAAKRESDRKKREEEAKKKAAKKKAEEAKKKAAAKKAAKKPAAKKAAKKTTKKKVGSKKPAKKTTKKTAPKSKATNKRNNKKVVRPAAKKTAKKAAKKATKKATKKPAGKSRSRSTTRQR